MCCLIQEAVEVFVKRGLGNSRFMSASKSSNLLAQKPTRLLRRLWCLKLSQLDGWVAI